MAECSAVRGLRRIVLRFRRLASTLHLSFPLFLVLIFFPFASLLRHRARERYFFPSVFSSVISLPLFIASRPSSIDASLSLPYIPRLHSLSPPLHIVQGIKHHCISLPVAPLCLFDASKASCVLPHFSFVSASVIASSLQGRVASTPALSLF